MCMVVSPTCLSVQQVYAMPAKARRGCRTPLGLELKMLVSYQVGVGKRNQILRTGNQGS